MGIQPLGCVCVCVCVCMHTYVPYSAPCGAVESPLSTGAASQ